MLVRTADSILRRRRRRFRATHRNFDFELGVGRVKYLVFRLAEIDASRTSPVERWERGRLTRPGYTAINV